MRTSRATPEYLPKDTSCALLKAAGALAALGAAARRLLLATGAATLRATVTLEQVKEAIVKVMKPFRI